MTETELNGKIAALLDHSEQETASKYRRRVTEKRDAAAFHFKHSVVFSTHLVYHYYEKETISAMAETAF